ncbi:hypothetical protein Ancab_020540 [Ancistrocladus abbreviatus]
MEHRKYGSRPMPMKKLRRSKRKRVINNSTDSSTSNSNPNSNSNANWNSSSMVVQKKVKKLQRLIPGGKDMNPDRLFLETAYYILQLRFQLHFLLALSKIYC